MKTDIEIARECQLAPIEDIARKIDVPVDELEFYGKNIAKVPNHLIDDEKAQQSNLILVTAITPTKAGIGKTTVSIGLALGLNKLGKKAICALREPSLGPCFGVKGGAAGGGYAQVLPMEKINLHFTGDFHAVTSANNMIAALLDNYIYMHREEGFALKEVLWKRVLDINDRNLRFVVTGLGAKSDGLIAETGFDITPASEIMAILCLATDIDDLRRRIGNIIVGIKMDDTPFRVKDMGVDGAITVLLLDAIKPNLVQTTEQTPAFVHGGPFANIAHGCNTVIATRMAMTFGEYVVTEAGFGADLGAEKFFNIKCRKSGLQPKLTVIVATTQGLKMHGGVPVDKIKEPDMEGLVKGCENLDRHIRNMQSFGQSVVVAFNRYATDTDEELELVRKHCENIGVGFAVNNAFLQGGEGATELAQVVIDTIEKNPSKPLAFTYDDADPIKTKIEKVAKNIYGAATVTYSKAAEKQLLRIQKIDQYLGQDSQDLLKLEHYPVCIAKTQYSFSAEKNLYGCPTGFNINIRDLVINSGSEMIVAIAGDIMRMPGLSKSPQAERIDLVNGLIEGLS
ncbi:MAG: formate--tetrahydrofolate ligase [Bacteroidaceae bacterium]|nr:formate--tetrahydrofolate ligase [Bacteroidaceae bacterium]